MAEADIGARPRPGGLGGAIFWGLMAFLSVGVAGHGLSFLVLGRAHLSEDIASNSFAWPYMIIVHAGAAGAALLLGPWQFLKRLRAKRPHVHRWMGRAYIAACAIGGVSGGLIAPFSYAGPIAGAGFLLLALAWLTSTAMAYRAALAHDFVRHERWMIRSFALTLAAVTLRIYLPLSFVGAAYGVVDVDQAYRAIAWLCWVPNLIAAEFFLSARLAKGRA